MMTDEATAKAIVRRYRDRYGYKNPDWIGDLLDDWRTGRDVTRLPERPGDTMNLRGVRNNFGPRWLIETFGEGEDE